MPERVPVKRLDARPDTCLPEGVPSVQGFPVAGVEKDEGFLKLKIPT